MGARTWEGCFEETWTNSWSSGPAYDDDYDYDYNAAFGDNVDAFDDDCVAKYQIPKVHCNAVEVRNRSKSDEGA